MEIKIDVRRVVVIGQIFVKDLRVSLIADLCKRSMNVSILLSKSTPISYKLAVIILRSFSI